MRLLRNLPTLVEQMPFWAQILVGALLVMMTVSSIYGRINVGFGNKIFSRASEETIRSDIGHIIQYTVIPVAATLVYFWAWLA